MKKYKVLRASSVDLLMIELESFSMEINKDLLGRFAAYGLLMAERHDRIISVQLYCEPDAADGNFHKAFITLRY